MLQIIKMIEQITEHPQRFDEGGEIILPFSLLENQALSENQAKD
jgi:hypothetical protein